MEHRWGYFPYSMVDYKAAEEYLSRKAAAGWMLKGIRLGCIAHFIRNRGEALKYCVDLHREEENLDGDGYFQLCADAGWEHIAQVRGMAIFASRPVCDPAPLQTDRAIEQEHFWRRAVRHALLDDLLGLVLLLGMLWALSWVERSKGAGRALSELLCSTYPLFVLLALTVLAAGLIWDPLYHLRRWKQWRRAEGGPDPAGSPFWTVLHGTLDLLPRLLMALYFIFYVLELIVGIAAGYSGGEVASRRPELREKPLVMAEELGADPNAVYYLAYEPVWSLQVRGARYVELSRENGTYGQLYCDRYTCVTEGYASLLADAVRRESGEDNYKGCGILDFQPVELGFDESWTAREGAFLLVREGKTVALVGTSGTEGEAPDLMEAELLDSLARRLELR